jgi:ankyrin repeat protein
VQTALHLASRRGCMPMLRLLLDACGQRGVGALRWRDASSDTPAQLAHKKGHPAVEAEIAHFLQAMRLAPARARPHQHVRRA